MTNTGLPQTPIAASRSQAAAGENPETTRMIHYIRSHANSTGVKVGFVYATQVHKNSPKSEGLVKVGCTESGKDGRATAMKSCGLTPGKIFETKGFQGAFQAEGLIHLMLSKWNCRVECENHPNKSLKPTGHREYFRCPLGFAISTIDIVTSWFLQEPYEIVGGMGRLKDDWRDALGVFEESQKSDHPMEWFEFFLIDVRSQLAWKSNPLPSHSPKYLPDAPVQILANGSLRFAVTGRKSRSAKSSPAVPQTASTTLKAYQTAPAGRPLSHSKSAPAKTSTRSDRSPSPGDTPSKPPKHARPRSRNPSKTDLSSEFESEERKERSSQEGGEEGEGEYNDNDNQDHTSDTGVDGAGLAAGITKLSISDAKSSKKPKNNASDARRGRGRAGRPKAN
ncbi:uncharacterized protein A1O5_08294 [Cladophialophora psammophila CBS 110553]|uniref:Bacteriophage T5 Orf172 DNA-binding domain-containing protein n=1 Tax=Cladophialophora psammophila CBS 110553 TaxID=1182543 RepID=W9WV33_9EURO|nr:uncharacterized protein A1O5_08294 [Cladophialophora psammophila CBS 110553]EXJ68501.1 hypothetical protein A1O5_08294 [Cladophialophora psammophila CBS 110553]